jgi:hypothetical protein
VTLALTSRALGPTAGADALVARARAIGVPGLVLDDPTPRASGWRDVLKGQGVALLAVRFTRPGPPSAEDLAVAGALRVPRVVVGSGPGEPGARAREVEALARVFHPMLAAGAPLVLRHAERTGDLLGLEEAGWLLEALPRLALWLDPAWLHGAERDGWGAGPQAWADRWAGRVAGVSVHGLGSDGRGHAHPEDDGPRWGTLAGALPRGVPWALDVSRDLADDDVREARRYLEAALEQGA